MKILVVVDEHERWRPAVGAAVEMLDATGELVLASVGELPETAEHREEVVDALQRRLARVASQVPSSNIQTRISLAGDPIAGIREIVDHVPVDRIVIGAHDGDGVEGRIGGDLAGDLQDAMPRLPVTVIAENGRVLVHGSPDRQ